MISTTATMTKATSNFDTLVLSGGANRGIMFGGAIACLEHRGILEGINTFVGTSIGALVAALLALGYTSRELERVVMNLNFGDLKPAGENEVMNFFQTYSRYSNTQREKVVRDLINCKAESDHITFKQLHDIFRITLVITACCVNTGETVYLSHRSEPDMSIYKAVCMSTSIPLIFAPYTHKGNLYIDGGAFGHMFPHGWVCDPDKTLGLKLVPGECEVQEVGTVFQYLGALLSGVTRTRAETREQYPTINLICELGSRDDSVPGHVKEQYIAEAYQTVEVWLRSLNLPE